MGFKSFNETDKKSLENESKKVESLYNEYKDKSQDELVEELYKHVAKQKQDGTFDYNSLENMLNKVSPFLTSEQKIKMKEILEQLK